VGTRPIQVNGSDSAGRRIIRVTRVHQRRSDLFNSFALKLGAMKALLAFAAGWIAFYLADQALYDGHHVRLLARFVGSIVSGFAFR
jgi:hypothetical protein